MIDLSGSLDPHSFIVPVILYSFSTDPGVEINGNRQQSRFERYQTVTDISIDLEVERS